MNVLVKCGNCRYWTCTDSEPKATCGKCQKNSPPPVADSVDGWMNWPSTKSTDGCFDGKTK